MNAIVFMGFVQEAIMKPIQRTEQESRHSKNEGN